VVLERLLKTGVSLLTFDRDTEQTGEAGKKIGVVLIESRQVKPVLLAGYAFGPADRNREPVFNLARPNTGTFAFRSCSWA
jgi:hypothetical protein